jgi:hypothetical protein
MVLTPGNACCPLMIATELKALQIVEKRMRQDAHIRLKIQTSSDIDP